MKNAKTMFRVMNEFKKVDTPTEVNETITQPTNDIKTTSKSLNEGGPTFFI